MKRILFFLILLLIISSFSISFSLDSTNKSDIEFFEEPTIINTQKNYVEGEILIKYNENLLDLKNTTQSMQMYTFNNSSSLEVKENILPQNISVVKIKDGSSVEEKILELKNNPKVEYAQPNYIYQLFSTPTPPNDTHWNLLWGLSNLGQEVNGVVGTVGADINVLGAWDFNVDGNNIVVAVIDSGVAYNHPDLLENMWDGSDCVDDNNVLIDSGCKYGYNYTNDNNDPIPVHSDHGTHVAGTIAAVRDNNLGIVGVAPKAKIMALRTDIDSINLSTDAIIKSINFAKYNGVHIINASFGGSSENTLMKQAIENFNGLFIAAAGNDTSNNDTNPIFPCNFDLNNIICVAATDQNDNLATFSNFGENNVHVGAPGVNIYSTITPQNYVFKNGTSMATPHVSGLAALIWSYNLDLNYIDVKNIILKSGDDLTSLDEKTITGKRINSYTAIKYTINFGSPITNISGHSDDWNNMDQNIILTCDHSLNSSCKSINYKLNDLDWNYVNVESIDSNSIKIQVTTEGENELKYFSKSLDDKNEEIKTIYVRIDKTPPVINLIENPGEVWQNQDFNINIDINFGISGKYIKNIFLNEELLTDNNYYLQGTDINIPIIFDGNNLIAISVVDNASNYSDLNIYTALDKLPPDVVFATTVNEDYFYGIDQNIEIKLETPIENSLVGSGIQGIDVNFYDINGLNEWVRLEKTQDNNFYFNTGDWRETNAHDFNKIFLSIKVIDNADNYTIVDLNTPIVLYDLNIPQGLSNNSTNFQEVENFEEVSGLLFEKTNLGKILFEADLNLLNIENVKKLNMVSQAIDINNELIENNNPFFDLNIEILDFLADFNSTIKIYNLPFVEEPRILHNKNEEIYAYSISDANILEKYLWEDGNLTFTAQGFSKYEFDQNMADFDINLFDITEFSAVVNITSRELIQCRFDTNSDLNYDNPLFPTSPSNDFNITINQLDSNQNYTYYFWCIDFAGNESNKIDNNILFTTLVDTTPPIININNISKTTNSATITVSLNEPSDCKFGSETNENFNEMNYDLSFSVNWTNLNNNEINVSGLSSNTTYKYSLVCMDTSSNETNELIEFTTNSPPTPSPPPSEGGGGGGGSAPASQEPKTNVIEEIDSKEINYESVTISQRLTNILDDEKIIEINNLSKDIVFSRNFIIVDEYDVVGNKETKTKIIVQVQNMDSRVKNFSLIEVIPKEILVDVNLISSDFEFKILSNNPIIEFYSNGQKEIIYFIKSDIDLNKTTDFTSPIISSIELVEDEEEEVVTQTQITQEEIIEEEDNEFFNILFYVSIIIIVLIIIGSVFAFYFITKKEKGNKKNWDKDIDF